MNGVKGGVTVGGRRLSVRRQLFRRSSEHFLPGSVAVKHFQLSTTFRLRNSNQLLVFQYADTSCAGEKVDIGGDSSHWPSSSVVGLAELLRTE